VTDKAQRTSISKTSNSERHIITKDFALKKSNLEESEKKESSGRTGIKANKPRKRCRSCSRSSLRQGKRNG
jgi:hypothetical protein